MSVHRHYDLFYVLRFQVLAFPISYLVLYFLSKDTTDYVAYVAKDPVNRRGIFPSCTFVSYSSAVIYLQPAHHSVLFCLPPPSVPHPGVL